ncbi:MAG: hypothetical protein BWX88_00543 [Planctomycetes bacterium ADurb.Bin126]|nr:MAG: hypothetical protein BWX88_00543 [Planctomycetes bacterium ADurb.Bin126]HOD83866.1 hypothetical protein [Phycisphaerae bacterium]HQL72321.1 hypothetical protein [Phycisphaerae bacterium]
MRRQYVVGLVVLAVAAALGADTIYTSDGVFEGTCTEQGDTVRIQTTGGQTVEMPKSKVLHVVRSSPAEPAKPEPPQKPATLPNRPTIFDHPTKPTTPTPQTAPATPATPSTPVVPATPATPAAPATPPKPAPATPAASAPLPQVELPLTIVPRAFTIESADVPEAVVFFLMRGISGQSADLVSMRQQLQVFLGYCHDQKRRSGTQWIGPADFVRHRQKFTEMLDEAKRAEQEARQLLTMPQYETRRVRDPRTGRYYNQRVQVTRRPSKQEEERLPAAAAAKLQQAAKTWPDPTLRSFLMGLSEYKAHNWGTAEECLRRACTDAPRVAGFWQAYGLVLLETKGYERAMQAFMQALRLQPDSTDAAAVFDDAYKKIPGSLVTQPTFEPARQMRQQYANVPKGYAGSGRNTSTTWLMPGRSWRVQDNTLPVPSFDRLTFRQAVGVPVGQHTLLVDESILKDAAEIFVKVGENVYLPAVGRPSTSYGGKSLGLAPIAVQEALFKPVVPDEPQAAGYYGQPKPQAAKELVKGAGVTVLAANFLEIMGSQVREVRGYVDSVDASGVPALNVNLMPGESASPVLDDKGQLAGFLAGRTNVTLENGGPGGFIPMRDLSSFLDQARRSAGSVSVYSRVKRDVPPVAAPATHFIVVATIPETFK